MSRTCRAIKGFNGLLVACALVAPAFFGAPAAASPATASAPGAPPGDIDNLVVKVFSTMRYPDPYQPVDEAGARAT